MSACFGGLCSAHLLCNPYCAICQHPSCEGTHAVDTSDPLWQEKRLRVEMWNHQVNTGRINIHWFQLEVLRRMGCAP